MTADLCGMISLHNLDQVNRKAEIGYWIAKEFEGKALLQAPAENSLRMLLKSLS